MKVQSKGYAAPAKTSANKQAQRHGWTSVNMAICGHKLRFRVSFIFAYGNNLLCLSKRETYHLMDQSLNLLSLFAKGTKPYWRLHCD